MRVSKAQFSPGWGKWSKEWGGCFRQKGPLLFAARGRGPACTHAQNSPAGSFISAEAALGLAERRAQGLDLALESQAERPLCRVIAKGCVRARRQVGVRRRKGATCGRVLGAREIARDWGGSLQSERRPQNGEGAMG